MYTSQPYFFLIMSPGFRINLNPSAKLTFPKNNILQFLIVYIYLQCQISCWLYTTQSYFLFIISLCSEKLSWIYLLNWHSLKQYTLVSIHCLYNCITIMLNHLLVGNKPVILLSYHISCCDKLSWIHLLDWHSLKHNTRSVSIHCIYGCNVKSLVGCH